MKKHTILFLLCMIMLGKNAMAQTNLALDFDGSDDFVVSSNLGTTTTDKTLSAWVKLKNISQTGGGLISFEKDDGSVFDAIVYNETGQGWGFGSNSFSRTAWSGVLETSTTTWVHIAATYSNNNYKLYRNGVLILSTTAYGVFSFPTNSRVLVGKRHTGGTNAYLNAQIDEIRVYNYSMTQTEVQNTMNCPQTGNETGLMIYYDINNASATAAGNNTTQTIATDLASLSGANNGTLTNFALTGATSNWVSQNPSFNLPYYTDADGDGYGDVNAIGIQSCTPIAGKVTNNTDCNDNDNAINPGAAEICGNAFDEDCDGIAAGTCQNLALDFDGVNDYISCSSVFTSAPSAFTIEWWLKPLSHTNFNQSLGSIVFWGAFGFHTEANGGVYCGTDVSTRFSPSQLGNNTIQLNVWQHFAFTYAAGVGMFYKNGVLLATKSMNAPAAWNGFSAGMHGGLDEVRIWNIARTQAQIQNTMNCQLAGNESGLVAYYNFTGSSVAGGNNAGQTSLADMSFHGNSATLNNFALSGATSNWVSNSPSVATTVTYYADADGDGFGNPLSTTTTSTCTAPAGYVTNNSDCNDSNPAIPSTTVFSYRTVQSGNWTSASTWEKFNGCFWAPASGGPSSADQTITIRNGHTVTLNSGINLSIDQTTVESGGTLALTNSTLTLNTSSAIVFNSGSVFNLSNGTLNSNGTLEIQVGATFNQTGLLTMFPNATLNNSGTWNWSAGGIDFTGGGSPTINNNGTWNITTDADAAINSFQSANISNTGTINKTGSAFDETGIYGGNGSSIYFTNSGIININSGKMNFASGYFNSGSINIATGATARFTGSMDAYFSPGTAFTGTGSINLEKTTNSSSILGAMSFGTPVTIATNTFNLISGVVSGNAQTLTFGSSSTVNWSGGQFIFSIAVINNSNNFYMTSAGGHGLCQTFTNNGIINWTGTGGIGNGSNGLGNATTVANFHNYGTFNINTDADVSSGPSGGGLTMAFTNHTTGIINKTGSASLSTSFDGAFFTCTNDGAINITTGNLSFSGTFNNLGTMHIPASSTVFIIGTGSANGTTFRLYSTTLFTGTGTLNIIGSNVTVVPISPASIGNITVIYNSPNGRIYGGTLDIFSTLMWTSGSINGVNFSIQANGTLITNGNVELKESTILTNHGTWNWINGNITATSVFSIGSDVNNVYNLGTWNLCGGAYTVVNYTTSNVVNIGTMNGLANFGTAGATPPANMIFSNSGTITVGTCGLYPNMPNYITSFAAYSPMCAGATFNVSFISGLSFGGGNIYTVQLSNASGSFAAPVSIGTLASTAATGVISATIPLGTTSGTGYRLRVVSTTPGYIGVDNGSNFTVSAPNIAATSATSDATFNEICLGNSTNLTAVGGSLGTGADWKWYSASCGGALVGTGATLNISPIANTSYFVRAEGGCNTTTCVQINIVVKTSPPATSMGTVTVPAYACNGNNIAASCTNVATATSYTWDGPTGTFFNGGNTNPFTVASNSVTVNYGPPNGSGYNICVLASNACGSTNRKCSFVRGTVNVPGNITAANGRTVECANTSANYSIGAVSGATSYSWTITGNATISGNGTSVTVNFGSGWTGGTLCVTANTGCYSSAARCIALSNSTSVPGAISGAPSSCPGGNGVYSIPVASGAVTYNWVLPANTSGSSNSNTINVNFLPGFTFGNIKVSITSICGVSSVQSVKTIVAGLPSAPIFISGSLSGLCGQSVVYSCPATPGATSFTWTSPGSINSGQGSTSVNASFGSFTNGNVCVKANNSCGSSAQRCVPVSGKPSIAGTITYTPGTICSNMPGVDFQISPVFGTFGYNWNFPSGVSLVVDLGNEQIVNWGSVGGTVSVTAVNACGNTTKTLAVSLGCREGEPEETIATEDNNVTIYPNPAHNLVTIQFNASESTNAVCNLLDLSGRIINSVNLKVQKGINNHEIDLTQLAKGVYIIELKSNLVNKKTRIVVG